MHKRKAIKSARERAKKNVRHRCGASSPILLLFFRKLEVEYRTRGFFIFHFFEFLEIFWLHAVFPLVYCGKKKEKKKPQ
jgi:hypothetical protein